MSIFGKMRIVNPFKKKTVLRMSFTKRMQFMNKVKNIQKKVRQDVVDRETKPILALETK